MDHQQYSLSFPLDTTIVPLLPRQIGAAGGSRVSMFHKQSVIWLLHVKSSYQPHIFVDLASPYVVLKVHHKTDPFTMEEKILRVVRYFVFA